MKLNFSGKQLTTIIVIFPLVTLLLYGGLSYIFFSYTQKKHIELELTNYKTSLLDIEKERLKAKVNSVTQLIDYYDTISNTKTQEQIKMITDLIVEISNNIYSKFHNVKYDYEVKTMIKNAVSNINLDTFKGYNFLIDKSGNALVHDDRSLQGRNILNTKDEHGSYFVKNFNEIIKNQKEGYITYAWHKINENSQEVLSNIAYIKALSCYDWYVGSAEYVKYANIFTEKEVIGYISSNSQTEDSYFFLFDDKNKVLLNPYKNNEIDVEDVKREGFHTDNKYLYYSKNINNRNLFLVATKSLDDLRNNMKDKQIESKLKREQDMNINFYILGLTWLLSLLLSIYLSAIVKKRLESYESQINQNKEKLIFQSKQALIGELFSMIAHQWRQPINKIASIIALLRFDLANDNVVKDDIDKSCEEIENSIEFMSETIDDFRTFYKPTTKTKMVNLKSLIGRSVLFLKSSIVKNDIKIIQDLEDINIELYRNEFLQVMLNLVKNAIDAIGSQGVIVIKLYKEDDNKVIISVENSGKSIDEKLINKIFDPYFTTKEDSMGLGLYMTKMIIEKHMNGTINVKPIKDGTIFTIELQN